jgi:hypothetical protein
MAKKKRGGKKKGREVGRGEWEENEVSIFSKGVFL